MLTPSPGLPPLPPSAAAAEKAVIGEGVDPRDQATAFGLFSLMWGAGALAGPLMGGALSQPCSGGGLPLHAAFCRPDSLLVARCAWLLPRWHTACPPACLPARPPARPPARLVGPFASQPLNHLNHRWFNPPPVRPSQAVLSSLHAPLAPQGTRTSIAVLSSLRAPLTGHSSFPVPWRPSSAPWPPWRFGSGWRRLYPAGGGGGAAAAEAAAAALTRSWPWPPQLGRRGLGCLRGRRSS